MADRICAHSACDNPAPTRVLCAEHRFWTKLDRSSGCWLWTGCVNPVNGYASVRSPFFTEQWVHRIAWTLTRGPIPKGAEVCHRCDVRLCCNPAHLFLGTHAENQRDMAMKGRAARGARVASAKLSTSDVLAIRKLHAKGVPLRAIVAEYGISKAQASRIGTGKRWTWLKEEAR